MKGLYRISLIVFACVTCCLAACTHSEVDIPTYAEGHPATVKLNFNVDASPEITTRAAQDTYYEYLVENIYVFVFSSGNRVNLDGQDFYTSTDIKNYIKNYKNKEDAANNTQSSGTIEFESISGSGLTIAAIANVGNSNTVLTQDDLSYDKIKTYADLQALAVSLDQQTVSRGRVFLMTGEVTADLKANETTTVTIPLKRTDSKITFNVTAAKATSNANITELEFIPGKWRVVNAPAKTWVLPREVSSLPLTEDLDAATVAGDFFTISETVAPQFEGKVNDAANSGTFTFYMPENLKAPKTQITDDVVPSFDDTFEGNPAYALREKQTKNAPTASDNVVTGQRYVNGDYVYAPKYGTYVVFTGELSYTDNSGAEPKYVIADVEYSVHLGHSGTENVNDYNTLRNHHYTYNVTITGVNSLIVEVDNDQEERPGAEGDVVISASEIHNVDGHYDRALITLTAEEASNLLFSVSTPWERGVDDMNGTADLHDYKWIKFLINSEVGVEDDQYAAFPGEDCYDGGKTETGTAVNSTGYGKEVTLRDIRQLSAYLSANQPTDDIVITAFIDEYLYFYNPTEDPLGESTTYKGVTQGTDDASLALWKQSVNQNDRLLHIIKAGDMKYSADGETSVSRSVVTFKQRPILTFYNVAADGLTTAWGTETINEIPRMPVTRSSYPSTQSNYVLTSQYNTAYNSVNTGSDWWPNWQDQQNTWADVISATEQYAMKDDYNDPSYACAIRNRDLNGDGEINTNEIQWYLAALDQLSDLWVGEPAMPAHAHLFDENNPDGYYRMHERDYPATHIVSSTISNSSPWIYWAEEYGATSTHAQAIGWNQAPTYNGDEIVSVRCVRNLGIAYNDTTTLPQDYVQVSPTPGTSKTTSTNNEYQIDLTYINPTALRTAADNGGALPYAKLNDVGENNRPYASFSVDPDYYGTNGKHTATNWYRAYQGERGEEDPICPNGYRVPNQREMLIMARTLDGWDYDNTNTAQGQGDYDCYIMLNGQEFDDWTENNFGAFYYYANYNYISRNLSTDKDGQTWINAVVRCVKDNIVASPTPATPASTYSTGGNLTGN